MNFICWFFVVFFSLLLLLLYCVVGIQCQKCVNNVLEFFFFVCCCCSTSSAAFINDWRHIWNYMKDTKDVNAFSFYCLTAFLFLFFRSRFPYYFLSRNSSKTMFHNKEKMCACVFLMPLKGICMLFDMMSILKTEFYNFSLKRHEPKKDIRMQRCGMRNYYRARSLCKI